MQIPRLIVHEYLLGLGVPGLAGIALVLLALVYGLAGLLPDWQSLQQLSQQTREAGEYLAKVEEGSVAAPVVPQRQLDDFRSKLPSQPQATVAIDKIYALAAQERITLARGEYSWASIPRPTWRVIRSSCRCAAAIRNCGASCTPCSANCRPWWSRTWSSSARRSPTPTSPGGSA